jgi:AmiR/NasT family two-component response regulator
MTALIILSPDPDATPAWAGDFAAWNLQVCGVTTPDKLLDEVRRTAAQAVLCVQAQPDEGVFDAAALLREHEPRPFLLFTEDDRDTAMARAVDSGVHVYALHSPQPERLAAWIRLATARMHHEQRLRQTARQAEERLAERKLVDRAKGILMDARHMPEAEAFAVLRTLSMTVNQRMGWVSQHVIDAAAGAHAINRAGQLRMLSQRLVKLRAFQVVDRDLQARAEQLQACVDCIEERLDSLSEVLPAEGAEWTQPLAPLWSRLKDTLAQTRHAPDLTELDAQAEAFLEQSERLTAALERAGVTPALRVVNLAGRQRMLSQRAAKLALLGRARPSDGALATTLEATVATFEHTLDELRAMPLSSTELNTSMAQADSLWHELRSQLPRTASRQARSALMHASEGLLSPLERLTHACERSMQVLTG